jgi:hypothetical protein
VDVYVSAEATLVLDVTLAAYDEASNRWILAQGVI